VFEIDDEGQREILKQIRDRPRTVSEIKIPNAEMCMGAPNPFQYLARRTGKARFRCPSEYDIFSAMNTLAPHQKLAILSQLKDRPRYTGELEVFGLGHWQPLGQGAVRQYSAEIVAQGKAALGADGAYAITEAGREELAAAA